MREKYFNRIYIGRVPYNARVCPENTKSQHTYQQVGRHAYTKQVVLNIYFACAVDKQVTYQGGYRHNKYIKEENYPSWQVAQVMKSMPELSAV